MKRTEKNATQGCPRDAVLRSKAVYRVNVRGSRGYVFAFSPDLPGFHVFGNDFRSLFLRLQEQVRDAAFLHPESDPAAWRRRHPGTHWYVRGDARLLEIVCEEWGDAPERREGEAR